MGICGRIHWTPPLVSPVAFVPHLESLLNKGSPPPTPSPTSGLWLGCVTHSFSTQDSEGPLGRSRPQFLRLADGGQSCVVFQVLLRSCLWVPPMELIKMQSSQASAPETLTCEAQVALGIALFRSPSAHPA